MKHAPTPQGFLYKLLIKFSAPLTLFLFALTLAGFYLGSQLQLKLSLTDLLPENHPSVEKFEELTKMVGGVGYLIIVLNAEDGKSHVETAPKLIEALKKHPEVRNAFIDREEYFFAERMLYYLDLPTLNKLENAVNTQINRARGRAFDLGLWDEKEEPADKVDPKVTEQARKAADITPILLSNDKKHLLLLIKPNFDSMDVGKSEELANFTKKTVEEILPSEVSYELAGRYYNKIEDTRVITSDIYILGILALVLIALVLVAYLRNWRMIVLIILPVLCGVGITVGATRLFIGHVNIITGFLMGIVSGLGMDYAIHLALRLRLEHQEGANGGAPDPIWRTLKSGGHGVWIGALAAAVAFFLLCFSDFRAFSEFGFVCGVGISSVALGLLVSFSTLARWLRLDRAEVCLTQNRKWGSLPSLATPRVFGISLVITIGLILASGWVKFEYNFATLLEHSKKAKELNLLVDEIYGRSVVPSAFAVHDKETALAIEEKVKKEYQPEVVEKIISGASIIPDHQNDKKVILDRIQAKIKPFKNSWLEKELDIPGKTIRQWVNARPFEFTDLPIHLQDFLRGTSGSGYLMYLYAPLTLDLGTAQGVYKFSNMVKDVEKDFPQLLSGSDTVLFAEILDLIKHDGLWILAAIFSAVFLFIWINVKRVDDTLTTYLPLVIALPVGAGLMALLSPFFPVIKFNIFNIAIIPSFVAIGIDVPIHVVHRARQTGSAFQAAKDLAPAVNLALLTTGVGFGVLILARAGVLRSLGWLALLGTFSIWWTGLFLLPATLSWFFHRPSKGSLKKPDTNARKASQKETRPPEARP